MYCSWMYYCRYFLCYKPRNPTQWAVKRGVKGIWIQHCVNYSKYTKNINWYFSINRFSVSIYSWLWLNTLSCSSFLLSLKCVRNTMLVNVLKVFPRTHITGNTTHCSEVNTKKVKTPRCEDSSDICKPTKTIKKKIGKWCSKTWARNRTMPLVVSTIKPDWILPIIACQFLLQHFNKWAWMELLFKGEVWEIK